MFRWQAGDKPKVEIPTVCPSARWPMGFAWRLGLRASLVGAMQRWALAAAALAWPRPRRTGRCEEQPSRTGRLWQWLERRDAMGMGGGDLLMLGREGPGVWDVEVKRCVISWPSDGETSQRLDKSAPLSVPRRSGAADAFWRLLDLADLAEELSVVGAAPLGPAAAELFDAFVEEVHRGMPGGRG